MKKFLLLVIISLGNIALQAQPKITKANMPAVGDLITSITYPAGENIIPPGAGGTALTWDYSALENPFPADSLWVVDAALTTHIPGFQLTQPDIALAYYVESLGEYSYTYYNTDAGMGYCGYGAGPELLFNGHSMPQIIAPMQLNDSFYDTLSSILYHSGAPVTISRGYVSYTADAWGTLTTPHHSYANALRLHCRLYRRDSSVSDHSVVEIYSQQWIWWHPHERYQLFTHNIDSFFINKTFGGFVVSYNEYKNTGPALFVPRLPKGKLSAYPNPATDRLYIQLDPGMENATLLLHDITGKTMQSLQATGSNAYMDLSLLPKGVYVLTAESNSRVITEKIVLR